MISGRPDTGDKTKKEQSDRQYGLRVVGLLCVEGLSGVWPNTRLHTGSVMKHFHVELKGQDIGLTQEVYCHSEMHQGYSGGLGSGRTTGYLRAFDAL